MPIQKVRFAYLVPKNRTKIDHNFHHLTSISNNPKKLMLDGESYGQFLFGFFNKQIHSIFLNPILIEKFDIKEIYENEFIDTNDEIEDFYLDKSMQNGNLYSTYVYAKKLNKKGQIQLIFNYLKERKDSEYKNIKYFYAKYAYNNKQFKNK